MKPVSISDITIRTDPKPGDFGCVVFLHGELYSKEYNFGISFESYVAMGLHEFFNQYDPAKDRTWICEHDGKMIGFLLLMHRPENTAQLRYFILLPEYRGIGLGKKLMDLYMEFLKDKGYQSSYLWTTDELHAAASLYTRHGFVLVDEKESTAFGKPLMERKYQLNWTRTQSP